MKIQTFFYNKNFILKQFSTYNENKTLSHKFKIKQYENRNI